MISSHNQQLDRVKDNDIYVITVKRNSSMHIQQIQWSIQVVQSNKHYTAKKVISYTIFTLHRHTEKKSLDSHTIRGNKSLTVENIETGHKHISVHQMAYNIAAKRGINSASALNGENVASHVLKWSYRCSRQEQQQTSERKSKMRMRHYKNKWMWTEKKQRKHACILKPERLVTTKSSDPADTGKSKGKHEN